MNCQDIAEQLPLLLYDELDAEEAAAIRGHLESCQSCAEHWREMEKTRQLLDEWKPAEAGAEVSSLLDDAPPVLKMTKSSRRRFSPSLFTGLAAAVLIMITLFFVGVDVQKTDGRLSVSFGRGAPPPVQVIPANLVDFDPHALESRIQQATYQQIDQSNFELVEQIDRFFNRWDESHLLQREELLSILAQAFEQDLSRLEQGISAVAQDNQRAIRQLEGLTLAVSRGELSPIHIIDPN